MQESRKKVKSLIIKYGLMVVRSVQNAFINDQLYEQAAKIRDGIKGYCEECGIPIPGPIRDEEDYKHEFWRLGLSGKTATKNYPFYFIDCYFDALYI